MCGPRATIGIDPGKDGFLCCLSEDDAMEFVSMPMIVPSGGGKRRYDVPGLLRVLRDWLDRYDIRLVVVEKQQVHPGQGSVSCFSLGEGFGLLVGIVAALDLSIECPHPRTWQKVMLRDTPGVDTKARSIENCGRRFPTVDLRRTERCKGPDHNKADSLLLAFWARVSKGTYHE